MGRSSLDPSSEQKPRVRGGTPDKVDPGARADAGSDVQEPGMRSGRRVEGVDTPAGQSDFDVDAGIGERAATVPETGNTTSDTATSDTAPDSSFATSGEIGDTGGATAQPARNEPGTRDGNRRMTRGNRLRRGLRSRRKTYRQR